MLSTLFFYQITTQNGKTMTVPTPGIDGVRVAVRVRPFSQVSAARGADATLAFVSLTF